MGNTLSNNKLITNTKSDKWSNVYDNPFDNCCLFISPNKYYYYKFHVKVLKDPLNKLPKNIKIVLDNNSLQLKKNRKVYCYIPYTEIKGWRTDETLNIWSFILVDSSSLVLNKNCELDKVFMFRTKQYIRISQLILSFTTHISTQLQYKKDRLDILDNINKKIKKNRKKNRRHVIEVKDNEVFYEENKDGKLNEDDVNCEAINKYSSEDNKYSSEDNSEYSSEYSSEDSSDSKENVRPIIEELLFIA